MLWEAEVLWASPLTLFLQSYNLLAAIKHGHYRRHQAWSLAEPTIMRKNVSEKDICLTVELILYTLINHFLLRHYGFFRGLMLHLCSFKQCLNWWMWLLCVLKFHKNEELPTVLCLVCSIYGKKTVGLKGQRCIQALLLLLALISYSVQVIFNARVPFYSFIYEHTQCLWDISYPVQHKTL